jgi:HEAT repeat protein
MALGVAALLAWRRGGTHEPRYKDKPLSYWLTVEAQYGLPDKLRSEILGEFGPAVVPLLIEQLRRRDSHVTLRLREAYPRLPNSIRSRFPLGEPSVRMHMAAAQWLGELGPAAAEAVPALIGVLDEEQFRFRTIEALGQIGRAAAPAIPRVIQFTTNRAMEGVVALRALLWIGGYTTNDLDFLLQQTNKTVRLVGNVGRFLLAGDTNGAMHYLAKNSVSASRPVLSGLLLKEYGPRAALVSSELTALLRSSTTELREEGALILATFGPGAAPAVSALVEALDTETEIYPRHAMMRALGAIGPAASNAIPVLEKLLHSNNQLDSDSAEVMLERIRGK